LVFQVKTGHIGTRVCSGGALSIRTIIIKGLTVQSHKYDCREAGLEADFFIG
jgi:hypothetical protein